MDNKRILENARIVLLIDWPSRDVPETLTRAGFRVFVHGGPGAEDYSVCELKEGQVVSRHIGHRPDQADLVYSYRPLAELPETIDEAKAVDAKIVWVQSGVSSEGTKDPKACWMAEEDVNSARLQMKASGLELITQPYIADVAREISRPG